MTRHALVCLLSLVASFAVPRPALALTVTSLGDNGPGTLREALIDATNGDTIDFSVTGTITLTTGELLVANSVAIVGPGVSALTIDANANGRVFHVTPGHTVSLSQMTLTDGAVNGLPDDGGGCVWNDGSNVTLDHLVIFECSAGYGGAALNDGTTAPATMRIVASAMVHNVTANAGAGAYNDGSSAAGDATLTIERCTFDRNEVTGNSGGALINDSYNHGQAALTVRASTFSGNVASNYGGAIWNYGDSGTSNLRVANSTFKGNAADDGTAIYTSTANGGTATTEIGNSLFTGTGQTVSNDAGIVTSAGFNVASDAVGGDAGTGPGGLLNGTNDRRNTDPMVGPLADNGGPTPTCPLLPESPAIDKGKRDAIAALADTTDQRGVARPVDDATLPNASGGDGSDIGAFELTPPPDLAVTGLKPPKRITLKASAPTVTKPVKVQIQNRGAAPVVLADAAALAGIVDLDAIALAAGCAAPAPTLAPGKANKLPRTLKPKKKATVVFTATFTCAVDPTKTTKKDPGHDDFRWVATVAYQSPEGAADTHADDDVCPRPALPGGTDPRPDPKKPIKDTGCGGKFPDKTLGADVTTDAVVK